MSVFEWGEVALVVGAVLIGFSVKGITGIGGPMLAIPVLAAFRGVEFAVAAISIPGLLANAWLLWRNRGARETETNRVVLPLLIAGVVGAVAGTWVLLVADDRLLMLLLAALVLAYVVLTLARPGFRLAESVGRWLRVPVGLAGGWLHGAVGISAPVFATYLHAMGLARQAFVYTITLLFTIDGATQVASLAALGGYSSATVIAGLVAAVPALVVLPSTNRLGDRLDVGLFRWIVLGILAVSAVTLIVGAI